MLGPSEGVEVIVRSDGVNIGRKITPLPSKLRERKTVDPLLRLEIRFILSPFEGIRLVKFANEIFLRRSIKTIRTSTVTATGAGLSGGYCLVPRCSRMRAYSSKPFTENFVL
jgi:hypothetical protein